MADNLNVASGDVDVVALVDQIFAKAIEDRASDIHLDPELDSFHIRYRIDGLLTLVGTTDKTLEDSIISRLKVLSQLDITERRLPQDGHLEFSHQDYTYNMRISTFPSARGEAVVMRILDRKGVIMEMGELGLEGKELDTVTNLIASPYGIILVTGPIGSGKTSLLYSMLNKLKGVSKNIVTIEDPVEVSIPDIRQLQVHENIGLDFSKAIRAIARQDPNVIMVGEVRDNETAFTAFQASLSGVLVFATFHTFDVPGLVLRLLEMNIPRSVLAHSVKGVISVRLVRKICNVCKNPQPVDATAEILKSNPCPQCHGPGYFGRIGIHEIVPFDNETKLTILEGASLSQLQELFKKKGYKTLEESGKAKVDAGITTAEEVARVIGTEV